MWKQISANISQTIGQSFAANTPRSVSGGCINQGYHISDGQRDFFVKINRVDRRSMFEAEAAALQQIADTQTIRVPQPISWGVVDDASYIVLEWLDLADRANATTQREMGRQLAQLHQFTLHSAGRWTF